MQTKWNDSRDETFNERAKIGFTNLKETWNVATAQFTEESLTICGHPVMESWEADYMKELARIATMLGGQVLEVGYGLGLSANYIQQQPIEEHIIIEANAEVLKKAQDFAAQAPRPVKLISGFWEDATAKMPTESFSGILFDTYPLTQGQVHRNHFFFFEEAFRLLKPGGVFTYYSDEITHFSPDHLAALKKAGFRNINAKICQVDPPKDCLYWKSQTILAPIIIK